MRRAKNSSYFSAVLAILLGISPSTAEFLPPTMNAEPDRPSGGGLAAAMKEQRQEISPVESLPRGKPTSPAQGEMVAQSGQPAAPAQANNPTSATPAFLPGASRDESRITISSDFRDVIRPLIRDALRSTTLPAETRTQLQTLLTQDTLTLRDVGTVGQVVGRALGPSPIQSSQYEGNQRLPYLPYSNDRAGVEVEQHRFAAGRAGTDASQNVIKTDGLRVCVAIVLYDPASRVGLVAHVDDWTNVAASIAPMRARFEALGGNFNTAQRSLVTPSPQAPIAARIQATPEFRSAQVYSGRAVALDLTNGNVSTYIPTSAANRITPQASDAYLLDLSRRNDRGHSPIEQQPALPTR